MIKLDLGSSNKTYAYVCTWIICSC